MVYAAFIALVLLLFSWVAVYAPGSSLREAIRLQAPALESMVFPVRAFWVLNFFPPWSPFAILAASANVSRAHPELASQFRYFRVSVYMWFVSLLALAASIYAYTAGYGG